jgi:hypothetical protein
MKAARSVWKLNGRLFCIRFKTESRRPCTAIFSGCLLICIKDFELLFDKVSCNEELCRNVVLIPCSNYNPEGILMRHAVLNTIRLSLFLLFLPMPAQAIPAIACHCFTERSYDAARPAAADPYLLATTQNSFFAIVFKTDKKSIVIKKQQGTSSDDLWIAYWVASRAGLSPETLLQARQKRENWKDALAPLRLTQKTLGTHFVSALNARASSAGLAEAVVDELFMLHRLMAEAELSGLRQAGASNQELIIATVLAARTRQPARQHYLEVKNGSRTWGALLLWANIDTKNMQREIAVLLRLLPE